jgi:hypothetical protein
MGKKACGLKRLLAFPQSFFDGFEQRTQQVFAQAALPRFDFNHHGHPRRKIHFLAVDLDGRAVHADPGWIEPTFSIAAASSETDNTLPGMVPYSVNKNVSTLISTGSPSLTNPTSLFSTWASTSTDRMILRHDNQ